MLVCDWIMVSMDSCLAVLSLDRKMEPAVPPIYAMVVVVWAVVFLQFWRRQNAGLQNK